MATRTPKKIILCVFLGFPAIGRKPGPILVWFRMQQYPKWHIEENKRGGSHFFLLSYFGVFKQEENEEG